MSGFLGKNSVQSIQPHDFGRYIRCRKLDRHVTRFCDGHREVLGATTWSLHESLFRLHQRMLWRLRAEEAGDGFLRVI